MCGRFTQHYTWQQVHEFLSVIGTALDLRPRYNIAPTTTMDRRERLEGPASLLRRGRQPNPGVRRSWDRWRDKASGEEILSATIIEDPGLTEAA